MTPNDAQSYGYKIAVYRGEMVEVTRFAELDGVKLYECWTLDNGRYLGLVPAENVSFALDSNAENSWFSEDDQNFLKEMKIAL